MKGTDRQSGGSLLNMGSRWTLVLCRGLSKPSSQESRDGRYYGSVNDSKSGIRCGVWVRVPPEALAPLESGGALTRPVWWNGRHARLKSGCPVGRASSSLATGTGGSEIVEYECVWARVVADIGACSPVVGAARGALGVLRLADGARVLVARRACSMAVLFPSFWTVILRGAGSDC